MRTHLIHPAKPSMRMLCALSFTALLLSICSPALGHIIYVKSGSNGDGTTWNNAYGDLQTALYASCAGDQIWVAAGTYTPGSNRSDTFRLKPGVQIFGGFEGIFSDTTLTRRKPEVHLTILSGDIDSDGELDADNSIHVVTTASLNATTAAIGRNTVLDGFVVTMGYADGPDDLAGVGAGMLIRNASPVIQNCVFSHNFCVRPGSAGMHIHSDPPPDDGAPGDGPPDYEMRFAPSLPLVRNCVFRDNRSGGEQQPTSDK